ncbi:MAG: DUF11 domain-containing protein [Calditrichaeota bacterium]|nr:DUF11 domain-containing protein [Calditrichota bacterium]
MKTITHSLSTGQCSAVRLALLSLIIFIATPLLAQIIPLDQRYWIVIDRGPDQMEADLAPQVAVPQAGHYRLKGYIGYNSGNEQLNESFYMLVRDSNGQIYFPLDANAQPDSYKVVPDDSVDEKHRSWRDAGLFYLPSSNMKYTIEFHHYATIWDTIPYFVNEAKVEQGSQRNAESLNVDQIELVYEPFVDGAVRLTAETPRQFQLGDKTVDGVNAGESVSYHIKIKNLVQDLMDSATIILSLSPDVHARDFSIPFDENNGKQLIWHLQKIMPKDSLEITFTADVKAGLSPGYTPLFAQAELALPKDSDPTNNFSNNTVYAYNQDSFPTSPTADITVSLSATTDSMRVSGNDTTKYVKPGGLINYTLTVANFASDTAKGITLYNLLPNFVSVPQFNTEPDYSYANAAYWTLSDLAPNSSVQITFVGQVDSSLKVDQFQLLDFGFAFSQNDSSLNNNFAQETVFLSYPKYKGPEHLDLSLTLEAQTDTMIFVGNKLQPGVRTGGTFQYTMRIINHGPLEANKYRTWINMPDSVEFSNFSIPPTFNSYGKYFWHLQHLPLNAETNITFVATAADSIPLTPFEIPGASGVYSATDSLVANNFDSSNVYAFTDTTVIQPLVDISVSQTALTDSFVVSNGDTMKYVGEGEKYQIKITVKNNGAADAKNVQLLDLLPDYVSVSDFNVAPVSMSGDSASWQIPILAGNAKQEFQFSATVPDTMPGGLNLLINKVFVTAENDDPAALTNNSSVDTVYNAVAQLVDVSVEQTALTDSFVVSNGDTMKYAREGEKYQIKITVKNNGAADAKDVQLLDLLPDYVSVSDFNVAPVSMSGDSASWKIPVLAGSTSKVFQFSATVPDTMPGGLNLLINKVFVSAENDDPAALTNNSSVDTVYNAVAQLVDVSVEQTAVTDSFVVSNGDTLKYAREGEKYQIKITVKNNSPVDAKNVNLVDVLPDYVSVSDFNVAPDLASSDSASWQIPLLAGNAKKEFQFSATVPDTMPGGLNLLINKVFVGAENDDPAALTNNSSVDTVYNAVAQLVDVSVEQTAVTDSFVVVDGDTMKYAREGEKYQIKITVKNNGPADAVNIQLYDLLPGYGSVFDFNEMPVSISGDSALWYIPLLEPGAARMFQFFISVPDSMPMGLNLLINKVWVSGENDDPNDLFNNTSVDTVYNSVQHLVVLSVSQKAFTDSVVIIGGREFSFARAGEEFPIQITVDNTSAVPAMNVRLTEHLSEFLTEQGESPSPVFANDDSVQWFLASLPAQTQRVFQINARAMQDIPIGTNLLVNTALISAENQDPRFATKNTSVDTIYNEVLEPIQASIETTPPVVDVGDSIYVKVQVSGAVVSYDLVVHLPDGRIDSTFADQFVARHRLTPNQWLNISPAYVLDHLITNARQDPIVFEIVAVDLAGNRVRAQATSIVNSSNYLVLDRNVYKADEPDPLGIKVKLSYRRVATLDVYDINGRHIDKLVQDVFDGGWTTFHWNGTTQDGQRVGSGVYLVTLHSGEFNSWKKFILVR